MHAETVLLVHYRQSQIAEVHVLGKDRMCSDEDVDASCFERAQDLAARRSAFTSGEERDLHARRHSPFPGAKQDVDAPEFPSVP